mgnify:CR=1 FL=1
MEKLTINDIATLAGVSIATVSNYINGNYNKMSQKTRDHLSKIINETNYRPNSTARNLAKNENKTIGVSIADITNPFTSVILSGISEVCDKYGYKVLFTNADNNPDTEINNIIRLRSENVLGFIIDSVNPNSPIYKSFDNLTSVMVDRQAFNPHIDTIVTDNASAVQAMTDKMMANGYDELYFISWPLDSVSTRLQRYQGFLAATGYENDDHLVTVPHRGDKPLYDEFNQRIKAIMEARGDKKIGFFTMNARVFLRLLKAMQICNYTYPTDYGVATYEEFDWMLTMRPEISRIKQDSREIGKQAAQMLHNKLEHPEQKQPETIIIPTSLVIKDSF